MRVCVRDGLRNHLGCCCSCCGFKVFRRWWVLTVLIAMMLWIRMHLDAEGIMLSNWRRCGEYHLHQFNHSSIHDPYIHPSLHQSIYSSTHPSMIHPCIHLFIHSSSHPLIHRQTPPCTYLCATVCDVFISTISSSFLPTIILCMQSQNPA